MNYKKWLADIRFWIILLALVRLYGITNPPLELAHNWRQTTVTMVARNFVEVNNNPLYPRIDFAGELTGITGMEFPVMNYAIYLISQATGYQHWYGRLLNLLISSLGLYFYYLLLKKFFDSRIAFIATIILGVSLWFKYSRKIMPDTFAMSLVIMSLYYVSEYFSVAQNKAKSLILFTIFLFIAGLSKLPVLYILPVLSLFVFNKSYTLSSKVKVITLSTLCVLPIGIWYFYWVPFLVEKYHFWHFFMGKSFAEGFTDIITHSHTALLRFYESAIKYIGFAAFIAGVYFMVKNKETLLLRILLIATFCFGVIVIKAGFAFYHHDYYIIPFVPVMALVAAYGLSIFKNPRYAYIVLGLIAVENIGNQLNDFRIKANERFLANIEYDLDKVMSRNDKILINCGHNPSSMYFTHRKGWIDFNENIAKPENIEALKSKGLKYVLILKKSFGTELSLPQYRRVIDNADYALYEI